LLNLAFRRHCMVMTYVLQVHLEGAATRWFPRLAHKLKPLLIACLPSRLTWPEPWNRRRFFNR
jgi:hypothetical protein